jgi:hypothetical protein
MSVRYRSTGTFLPSQGNSGKGSHPSPTRESGPSVLEKKKPLERGNVNPLAVVRMFFRAYGPPDLLTCLSLFGRERLRYVQSVGGTADFTPSTIRSLRGGSTLNR